MNKIINNISKLSGKTLALLTTIAAAAIITLGNQAVSAVVGGGGDTGGGSSSGGGSVDNGIPGGPGSGCSAGKTCYSYKVGATFVYTTAAELEANGWQIRGSNAFPGYTFNEQEIASIRQLGGIFGLRAIGHITGTDNFTRYGGFANISDIISGKLHYSEMGGYTYEAVMEFYAQCKAAGLCSATSFDWMSFFEFDLFGNLVNGDEVNRPEEPINPDANGTFNSSSAVKVTGGSGGGQWGVSGGSDYLGREFSSLNISTDDSSVNVTFIHRLSLSVDRKDFVPKDGDRGDGPDFEDAKTNYTITGGVGGPGGTWEVNSWTGGSKEIEVPVTIGLGLGETKTICQAINYTPKYYTGWSETPNYVYRTDTYWDTTILDWNTRQVVDYTRNYTYKLTGTSGNGRSEACITLTRPNDPSGDGAKISNDRLYTGEKVSISWDGSAPYYDTRHIIGAEYPYMVHQVNQTNLNGGTRMSVPPSQHYSNLWLGQSDGNYTTYVVPSLVGHKVCGSQGFNIGYFWSANGGPFQQESRSYWYNYGLACSYIAKKPSLAVWNSNVFTNSASNIYTSLATRDNSEDRLAIVSPSNSSTVFGSWGEFLGVIGNTATGFSTGATRSTGNTSTEPRTNNPLTISNDTTDSYGHSGISYNTATTQRFETYFKSRATQIEGNTFSGYTLDQNRTTIYSSDHSITIDNNIINNNGTYSDIYSIPQTILFVNGDVNITGNVTQIDAWIIATGNVNTCSNFRSGETQAAIRDLVLDNTNESSNNVCQKQLTFNGPVMAASLTPRRSYGADMYYGDKWVTAEIFNYRADSLLWSYAQAGRYASSYNEVYTRELAPRY